MSRHPRLSLSTPVRLLGPALLGLSLLLPMAPAQASEVVKLARLLITGKRQPASRRWRRSLARPTVEAPRRRPVPRANTPTRMHPFSRRMW